MLNLADFKFEMIVEHRTAKGIRITYAPWELVNDFHVTEAYAYTFMRVHMDPLTGFIYVDMYESYSVAKRYYVILDSDMHQMKLSKLKNLDFNPLQEKMRKEDNYDYLKTLNPRTLSYRDWYQIPPVFENTHFFIDSENIRWYKLENIFFRDEKKVIYNQIKDTECEAVLQQNAYELGMKLAASGGNQNDSTTYLLLLPEPALC